MKKFLLAGVASIALLAGAPANAADLGTRPTYKTPPAVAPVPLFTWTGCYIGAHIGGGWGRKDFSDSPATRIDGVGGSSGLETIRADVSGFLGGGQVGCDYQLAPNWVIGIQGDFSGADITGDVRDPFFTNKVFRARTDWLATVTARVGWAWDRWLIYVKGGGAWAHDKYHGNDFNDGYALDASETRTGWTGGGGIEWAFARNWSAFLEYDFYGFGTRDLQFIFTPAFSRNPLIDVKQDINAVKFGINYRFNFGKTPTPVVARY